MRSICSFLLVSGVIAVTSLFSQPLHAQAPGQQTVVIEGDIFESNIAELQPYQEFFPLRFVASVGENPATAQLMFDEPNAKFYWSSTFEIAMQIFGPENNLIFEQSLNIEGASGEEFGDNIAAFTFNSGEESEQMMEGAFWGALLSSEAGFQIHEVALGNPPFGSGPEEPQGETGPVPMLIFPGMGSLFADTTNYPVLATGETFQPFQYNFDNDEPMLEREVASTGGFASGIALAISYGDLDSDGDGVPDFVDSCPASILNENVLFGEVDSGVTNRVDENGCSIMDRYAKCEAEAAEEPSSPWGWFQPVYSGPSYCEKQVVYGLQDDGVIDYTEGRMLRNALNTSYN
ncbi:hypothetical protein J6J08_06515 [Pseudidiomarina sp. 1APR75-33.1]|uniref:hypothetical protein n=1 Tax=Pseudidiomarina terrestris TaxID=2820060 RepID=UPI00264BF9B6|nr:hypothetical protein [Pseudidiomarina sp. 1APR75-33.1]MDN7127030.1 hypothetical protein [Pseudidiomarina sp. 1APR75-33.1]